MSGLRKKEGVWLRRVRESGVVEEGEWLFEEQ